MALKVKRYNDIMEYLNIEEHEDGEIAIVNRGKWIDIDCMIEAKTVYEAFRKLSTQIKKYGFTSLENDMKYKDDFLQSVEDYNRCYPYPDEHKNGFYGYTCEGEPGSYYVRYFIPSTRV